MADGNCSFPYLGINPRRRPRQIAENLNNSVNFGDVHLILSLEGVDIL